MSRRSPLHWFPAGLILLFGLAAAACGNDNPKLTVTGIDPKQGDVTGDTVHIYGSRFTTDPRSVKVYFGGHPAQVNRFVSDSELTVTAPGGKLNDVIDVLIVFEPGGRVNLPGAYRYVEKNKAAPSVDDLNISPDKPRK